MNLIQQLQTTSKWKEFEEWYLNKYSSEPITFSYEEDTAEYHPDNNNPSLKEFCLLEIPFQKGVFEKFIEQKFEIHFDSSYTLYHKHVWEYVIDNNKLLRSSSFEELLIWYFNY